jgi:predicted DNA-binding transcriptional regulator AlpA
MRTEIAIDGPLTRPPASGERRVRLPSGFDPLLTEKQLSGWLGLSLPTLQRLRTSGSGPRFVQLSNRRLAYRKSVVEQWLEQRTKRQVCEENAT